MTHSERRNMWIERISTFKESGLSLPKWCAANDIDVWSTTTKCLVDYIHENTIQYSDYLLSENFYILQLSF